MQQILATENRVSKLFQFSERKVRDYFKTARVSAGKYDLLNCIEIFVENSSGKDEATELKRAEKALKEYKLKILKKEYHAENDVVRIVSDMNYNFKAKLMALPSKLSVELTTQTNQLEIEKILKDGILEALNELKEYEYQGDIEDESSE